MAAKKVIAICQSGGEFVTNKDGSLSYNGGEAYAIDIDEQTKLNDFKSEVAEMFNCSKPKMVVKYFLPSNKKTPITISKDKDLQRMINFVGDSGTVDVYIMSEEAAARNTPNMPARRSSRRNVAEVADPVPAPVDVPMANGIDQGDVDLQNETPIMCTPLNRLDEKQAAQQWENTITGVDQRFGSINEFREALHKYSIAHGFAYRYKKNDSRRVTVVCKAQGCPWRIYASRLATTQLVSIKKMNPKHTCEGATAKAGHRSTRGWVGSIIKEKLKTTPNYKPKDIAEDIRREYGVQLNYSQARRAKKIAKDQLQGSFKEAYALIPYFCEKIKETNPGSIATFTTKDDSSFHRLFFSFHASISGFQQGCRPLLLLDSTPVNSKYPANLLSATAADAQDGIFPVAFAIVDAEDEENWHWFLQELKSAASMSSQITFISDFQHGLKKALAEIFDQSHHSYCLRHLAEQLIRELKGQFSHEARRLLISDFYSAANALTLDGFKQATENIKAISSDAYDWVIQSEPEHWASAFFGGARYNHTSSNFGHPFYGWVSEAGELPITQMIDVLRGKLMESIYKHRIEASQWTTKLTPSNEEKLQTETAVARSFQVLLTQGNVFEVRGESVYVVDIDHWDCSCKGWQLTGLPCCHAIAVSECIGKSPYDFCSRYFTTESYRLTYAESIYPVPNVDLPDPDESAEPAIIVTPPPAKSQQGRSKSKPTESIDMTKLKLQCSKCKGLGHNKRTCKESTQSSESVGTDEQ
ncbi:hypothetical protein SLE2022_222940 [Rubroshorea leprosula]